MRKQDKFLNGHKKFTKTLPIPSMNHTIQNFGLSRATYCVAPIPQFTRKNYKRLATWLWRGYQIHSWMAIKNPLRSYQYPQYIIPYKHWFKPSYLLCCTNSPNLPGRIAHDIIANMDKGTRYMLERPQKFIKKLPIPSIKSHYTNSGSSRAAQIIKTGTDQSTYMNSKC